LDLWNEAEFIPTNDRKISLTIEGEGKDKLPLGASNAIVDAALQVYTLAGKSYHGMQIRCINRVPLGSGLGSSSAALLTGMLGANAILGEPLSREEILKLAIETEGHPDNVAPAMLGGLVASIIHESHVISLRITLTDQRTPMYLTVVFPDFDFPTKQARLILPKQIELKDAIYNISRAVIITEAFRLGSLDMLHEAMDDKLHQPYRIPLIPGAQAAMDAAKQTGAAAVALSGAGPSLIAFSSEPNPAIGEAMKHAFEAAGLQARIFPLKMSDHGAEVHIR
jgi:homoserine kinase